MKPISRGPWTISLADELGTAYKLRHRKNYLPEDNSMADLLQLSRLIRRAEKWARISAGKRPAN